MSSDACTASWIRVAASVSPRNSSIIAALMIAARGSATPVPAMSGAEPCTGSNSEGPVRAGFRFRGCGPPDAPADRTPEVGEDVAEQVVGDNDVVLLGALHEMDARSVDVVIARRDVRVLRGHDVERALPQVAREGQDVGLVDEVHPPSVTRLRKVEHVSDASLDAHPGVHRTLRRDLVRGVLAQEPTFAGVTALRVLADDDHVHATVRARSAGAEKRAMVHVQIDREPHLEEQATFQHPGGTSGVPTAPSRIASNVANSASTSSGRTSPVARYRFHRGRSEPARTRTRSRRRPSAPRPTPPGRCRHPR